MFLSKSFIISCREKKGNLSNTQPHRHAETLEQRGGGLKCSLLLMHQLYQHKVASDNCCWEMQKGMCFSALGQKCSGEDQSQSYWEEVGEQHLSPEPAGLPPPHCF